MNKLNDFLVQSRAQGRMRFNDTMDMILFMYDPQSKMFCFSGSKQKVIIIRNKEILEFNTDHFNLGDDFGHTKSSFSEEKLTLKKNDIIYLFTDGYVDQFGGEKGKKYKSAQFKKFLLSINNNPMEKQKELIAQNFDQWRGNYEQIDDVCVMGVRVT